MGTPAYQNQYWTAFVVSTSNSFITLAATLGTPGGTQCLNAPTPPAANASLAVGTCGAGTTGWFFYNFGNNPTQPGTITAGSLSGPGLMAWPVNPSTGNYTGARVTLAIGVAQDWYLTTPGNQLVHALSSLCVDAGYF